jgi:hypothetical protein
MPDGTPKRLADMLDLGCFFTILALYAAALMLLATLARKDWPGVLLLLPVVAPLGLWLAALVHLRRYLETDRKGTWLRWERLRIAMEHHIDEHYIDQHHLDHRDDHPSRPPALPGPGLARG